ncbi:MAG: sugar ABC transporter substrate-binding protein [Candidatus Faecousia sp.]|nr:sugar ABC transporter substrate-binding protein [Candidatus Faecousia sp.]
MKRLVALLLVMAMTFALCACNQQATTPTAAPTQASKDTPAATEEESGAKDYAGQTIRVAMWGDNTRKDLFEGYFETFEKAHNCNVEVEVYASSEYATKVLTETAGGNGPDVVWLTERYYPMFADAGYLADMNALMTDPEYKFDDYSTSLVGNYLKDGNLTAIPFTANPLAFFYNATLFKNAGLETPLELYNKGQWTIDKMLECAAALTDKSNGTYGLSLVQPVDPTNWPVLLDYFWAMGADMFNEDTTKCVINNDAGVAAIQKLHDLMFTEKTCVVPGEMISFESGQLAMYPGNPSEGSNYQNVDFEWDYITFPAATNGELINVVGVALYGVMNTSKNVNAAIDVVKFITGEEMQSTLSGTFTPTRESLKNSEEFLNKTASMPSPDGRRILYLDVFAANTRVYPATTNWNEVNEIGKQIFDKLYTGSIAPADIAAELESSFNALLAK